MAIARDHDTELFKATESRLEEWGRYCRASSQELGLPVISSFAQTAEHVRRREREDRKRRKDDLRRQMREQAAAGGQVDCKIVAQASGHAELENTASGKETRAMRTPRVVFSSEASTVEQAVRALPKWMQTPIFRTYLYGQPHRIAAGELRMPVDTYRKRWEAAVIEAGRILAMRESGAVHSPRPPVRVESA
jgi:DNA-directed RNA polymerase specialized sigma24 family protein